MHYEKTRILHVSDLHRGKGNDRQSLDEMWSFVRAFAGEEKFDYITITGDLTDGAEPEEYDDLLAFLPDQCRYLLHTGDLSRVVLVPGNHDVYWPSDHLVLADDASFPSVEEYVSALRGAIQPSPTSGHRVDFSKFGRAQLYELRQPDYGRRFESAQRFLNDFHDLQAGGEATLKKMNLLTAGDDWSVHAFPEQGIAFVGLNSCHRNDRLWNGAAIDDAAIQSVKKFFRENDLRRIPVVAMVWHHGIGGAGRARDYVSWAQVGRVVNDLGARAVFHGHVHETSSRQLEHWPKRVLVSSSGSLGAKTADRPDAVARQFAVADLIGDRAYLYTVNLKEDTGAWYPGPTRRVSLSQSEKGTSVPPRVSQHKRNWSIRHDGQCVTTVKLLGVQGTGELCLAALSQPFGKATCSKVAPMLTVSSSGDERRRRPKVTRTRLPCTGFHAAVQVPSKDVAGVKEVDWEYSSASEFALYSEELAYLRRRKERHPTLDAAEEAAGHTVTVDYDQLDLAVEYEANSLGRITEARVLVEAETVVDGRPTWEEVPNEARRLEDALEITPRTAQLEIAAPIVGYRYSIAFKPEPIYWPIPDQHMDALELLIGKLRVRASPSRAHLTTWLRASIRNQVPSAQGLPPEDDGPLFSDEGAWCLHLWSAEHRKLIPVCGEFSPETWSIHLDAGVGVAGHAFRWGRPAAWLASSQGKESGACSNRDDLIYQDEFPWNVLGSPDWSWVLSVPLAFVGPYPLAVLSFSSPRKSENGVAGDIYELARKVRQTQALPDASKWMAALTRGFLEGLDAAVAATGDVVTNQLCKAIRETAESGLIPTLGRRLGDILVARRRLDLGQVESVLEAQRSAPNWKKFGAIAVSKGLIAQAQLDEALAHQRNTD